jgi:transcriptional regulator with XRE-family HTH domain
MEKKMKHGDITRIAEKVGVTKTYISFILKGKKIPSAQIARKLEEVTGVERRAWLYPNEFRNPFLERQEGKSHVG